MTDLDLDALAAVAEAATPGPWKQTYDRRSIYSSADVHPGGIAGSLMSHGAKFASADDAHHIATFDPPTVLALIAEAKEAQRLRKEVAALADEAERRGEASIARDFNGNPFPAIILPAALRALIGGVR